MEVHLFQMMLDVLWLEVVLQVASLYEKDFHVLKHLHEKRLDLVVPSVASQMLVVVRHYLDSVYVGCAEEPPLLLGWEPTTAPQSL